MAITLVYVVATLSIHMLIIWPWWPVELGSWVPQSRSKPRSRAVKFIQSEDQEKKRKKNKNILRDLWNTIK